MNIWSIYGSFDRSITCRKGKLTRISIYSSKGEALSFLQRNCFNVINLLPDCLLVTLGNGAISGAQCWSLLLVDVTFTNICSQISPGEGWSMWLSPHITSISATMTTLFMGPLGNDRNGWGKRLTVHRTGHPVYLVIELLC